MLPKMVRSSALRPRRVRPVVAGTGGHDGCFTDPKRIEPRLGCRVTSENLERQLRVMSGPSIFAH